jgi:2-polyprenyl-3-methyl-5-hydroxy-6-metoxy-1,4-benzoquinol methylase
VTSMEPDNEKEFAASNDDWERHWQLFADSAALNPAQAMRHQFVLDLWSEHAVDTSSNFVDFGSGQGDFLEKFGRRYPHAKLLGLELSARGVAISRQKTPSATFIMLDLFSPSQEMDSYHGWAGGAVCSEVLEHVDDPTAFLRAASQYLSANAMILITVPSGRMSAFDRHIGHRRHFTRESLHETLVQSGYRVEKIYRAGFPFFNLYRLAVIARGAKLASDAEREPHGAFGALAGIMARLFGWLFKMNLRDSPFGWQLVAVAFTSPARPKA